METDALLGGGKATPFAPSSHADAAAGAPRLPPHAGSTASTTTAIVGGDSLPRRRRKAQPREDDGGGGDDDDSDAASSASYEAHLAADATGSCTCFYNRHVLSLLLLSMSFFFLFAPFSAIQNLESSLNAAEKLGVTAVATLYLVYTAGCLLAPAVVGTIGPRRSMILGGGFVCIFITAHFRPAWSSLIPASALVGLACAFMWAAQGVYITQIAVQYAESTGAERFAYLGMFNGIFWGLFNCNQIAGNLISSIILHEGQNEAVLARLFSVFLGLSAFAIGSLFFLRDPSALRRPEPPGSMAAANKSATAGDTEARAAEGTEDTEVDDTEVEEEEGPADVEYTDTEGEEDNGSNKTNSSNAAVAGTNEPPPTIGKMLKSMVTIMKQPQILLLLPMFFYSGAVFGFLCGDFTNSLVQVSLGVHEIGLVMSAFGLGDGLACLLFGQMSDTVGRGPILLYGIFMHSLIFLFLLTWSVHSGARAELYTVAVLYGTADAAWVTQVYSIIGARFSNNLEAAVSTYRMWNSIGMAAAFFASARLGWHTKVVLLFVLVGASAVGYALLLLRERMLYAESAAADGAEDDTDAVTDTLRSGVCPAFWARVGWVAKQAGEGEEEEEDGAEADHEGQAAENDGCRLDV